MPARMSGLERAAIVHAANTKSGGGFLFSGHHSNKDLLIISDFTTKGLPQELKPSPQLRHCAGLGSEPAAKRHGRILLSHFCSKRDLQGDLGLCRPISGDDWGTDMPKSRSLPTRGRRRRDYTHTSGG